MYNPDLNITEGHVYRGLKQGPIGLDIEVNSYCKKWVKFQRWTRHVFMKHGCPRRQQSQNMAKISKSNILTPPHPQAHGMSVKCEELLDELTVQVWLLYLYQNFLLLDFVCKRDGITDRQTNRRTDDPITKCPWRTIQVGSIKRPTTTMLLGNLNTRSTKYATH